MVQRRLLAEARQLFDVAGHVERLLASGFRGDLYTEVAAECLGIPAEQVQPQQRQQVKNMAFHFLYGVKHGRGPRTT